MENNKKIVVYTGLTIPFDEAKEILDGIYKPPIKRGELFDLIENEKDIAIKLNGYLKEINNLWNNN